MHNVLALSIIVQKHGCQPIHLPVMLSEQRLKCLFSFRHTPIIHIKTDLLNPKGHLFSFFFVQTRFHGTKIVISSYYIIGRKRKSYREKQLKQKKFVLLIQKDNTDVAGQIEKPSIPEQRSPTRSLSTRYKIQQNVKK